MEYIVFTALFLNNLLQPRNARIDLDRRVLFLIRPSVVLKHLNIGQNFFEYGSSLYAYLYSNPFYAIKKRLFNIR
jgi:hypothetical protein